LELVSRGNWMFRFFPKWKFWGKPPDTTTKKQMKRRKCFFRLCNSVLKIAPSLQAFRETIFATIVSVTDFRC
jgi:hypothetical protein